MKVEATVLEVSNGSLIKVEIDGVIFVSYVRSKDKKGIEPKIMETYEKPISKEEIKKKIRRRKPKGAITFDKKYGIWVREKHVKAVEDQIGTDGLRVPNLSVRTGLPPNTVYASLHYLERKKLVKKEKHGIYKKV